MTSERCANAATETGKWWGRTPAELPRILDLATEGFTGARAPAEDDPPEERAAITLGVCWREPAERDELQGLIRAGRLSTVPGTGGTVTIRRRSISWTLEGVEAQGTFANGDPWVSGARVTLVSQDPPSTLVSGRTKNGTMLDPDTFRSGGQLPGMRQGFDSAAFAQYGMPKDWGPELNIGTILPFELPSRPIVSLVTARSAPLAGARPQLDDAAVLTVLREPPPDGTGKGFFRPPWSVWKEPSLIPFNLDALALERLGALPALPGMPSWATMEKWLEATWLQIGCFWTPQTFLAPKTCSPGYGREIADQLGLVALALNTDAPLDEKRHLLTLFLQVGLDFAAIAKRVEQFHKERGRTGLAARTRDTVGVYEQPWPAGAGHHTGRKIPILFAGLLLDRPDLVELTKPTSPCAFSEDDQIFRISQQDIDLRGYKAAFLGVPEYRATRKASDHVPGWTASNYRECCTFTAMYAALLAALAMKAKDEWGKDETFDYQARFRAEEPRSGASPASFLCWPVHAKDWALRMWDAYSSDLGVPAYSGPML